MIGAPDYEEISIALVQAKQLQDSANALLAEDVNMHGQEDTAVWLKNHLQRLDRLIF